MGKYRLNVVIRSLSFLFLLLNSINVFSDTTRGLLVNIPYPNRSMYLSKGIVGSMSLGRQSESFMQYSVPSIYWQTGLGFYYTPRFSGRIDAQILAGDVKDTLYKVQTRYAVETFFHFPQNRWSIRVGPYIGYKSYQIQRNTFSEENSAEQLTEYFVYGVNLGMGGLWTSFFGWTSGVFIEGLSLEGYTIKTSVGGSWNIHMLRKLWRKNARAVMAYLETQVEWGPYNSLNINRVHYRSIALICGFAMAF